MKKSKLFGWAFVALASLSACTDNAGDVLAQESEIRLTSKITPSRVTSLDYQSTQIVPGQEVGVTITGAKTTHKNVAWKVGEDGVLTNTGAPVFWTNEDVVITAYHPYNSEWTGTDHDFLVSTDQSNEANYRNSDLLWAMATSSMTETAIPLVFDHKLAKVNVTLKSDDIDDLNGAVISICGTNVSTSFNPATGRLSATATNVQEIKAGVTTSASYTASAIVVPQTVAHGTKFIKIVLGDRTFYYTLSADKELRAGCSHNYTLTIMDKEVTAESDKITDWEDDDNEGDVEEELISKYADGVAFVAKAGELSSIIPEAEKYTITSLTISGELNGTDIKFIRENMAGCSTNSMGSLKNLDLSDVTMAEGGDDYAFGCKTEKNVISTSMFEKCKTLESVVLPRKITAIGVNAFSSCSNLKSVVIFEGVKSIGYESFAGCNLLEIVIPEGVETVGKNSFSGNKNLKSVIIPQSVVSIGTDAFSNHGTDMIVYIQDLSKFLKSYYYTIFYSNVNTYRLFLNNMEVNDLVIPDGITEVPSFAGCSSLTSVTLPEGAYCIDGGTFENCINLREAIFPNSYQEVPAGTFAGSGLTTMTIGNNVTTIYSAAFWCPIKDFYSYTKTPPAIDVLPSGMSYKSDSFLTEYKNEATLHVPAGCKAAYQASKWANYFGSIVEM